MLYRMMLLAVLLLGFPACSTTNNRIEERVDELWELVEVGDVTEDEFARFLGEERTYPTFTVNVDCGSSQAKTFMREHFRHVEFPESDCNPGKVEIFLQQFDLMLSPEEVVMELDKLSLRPANFSELTSLWLAHPDLRHTIMIAAFGWVNKRENSRTLSGQGSGGSVISSFSLTWNIRDGWHHRQFWGPGYRFAAVRK